MNAADTLGKIHDRRAEKLHLIEYYFLCDIMDCDFILLSISINDFCFKTTCMSMLQFSFLLFIACRLLFHRLLFNRLFFHRLLFCRLLFRRFFSVRLRLVCRFFFSDMSNKISCCTTTRVFLQEFSVLVIEECGIAFYISTLACF